LQQKRDQQEINDRLIANSPNKEKTRLKIKSEQKTAGNKQMKEDILLKAFKNSLPS
jgi:hypothetical protein